MQFDTKAFHAKFAAKYPQDGERFGQLLQSYAWKREYASYHVEQAREYLAKSGHGMQGTTPEMFEQRVFARYSPDPEIRATEQYRLIVHANVIAAAKTVHSMHDLFNHLCYVGLHLQSTKKLKEHKVNWERTRELLESQAINPHFLKELDRHRASKEFKYLDAFVNTTKHNLHILSNSSVDYQQNKAGFFLYAFTHKEVPFPEKWIEDFLTELKDVFVSLSACLVTLETLV